MGGDDHVVVGMRGHNLARPRDLALAVRERQRQHQELRAVLLEGREVGAVVARRDRAAVPGACPRTALGPKYSLKSSSVTPRLLSWLPGSTLFGTPASSRMLWIADARSNSMRARTSFSRRVDPVLDEVAGAGGERDLAVVGVVGDPARQLRIDLGVALGEVLRVGDAGDREVVVAGVLELLRRSPSTSVDCARGPSTTRMFASPSTTSAGSRIVESSPAPASARRSCRPTTPAAGARCGRRSSRSMRSASRRTPPPRTAGTEAVGIVGGRCPELERLLVRARPDLERERVGASDHASTMAASVVAPAAGSIGCRARIRLLRRCPPARSRRDPRGPDRPSGTRSSSPASPHRRRSR